MFSTSLCRHRPPVLILCWRNLKSSLEAEVEIVYPDGVEGNELVKLLRREGKYYSFRSPRINLLRLTRRAENYLKTLLIVSNTSVRREGDMSSEAPEWHYSSVDKQSGQCLFPASSFSPLKKCPQEAFSQSTCGLPTFTSALDVGLSHATLQRIFAVDVVQWLEWIIILHRSFVI